MNSVRWTVVMALSLGACGAHAQSSCAATGDVTYVCGPQNPEDLVLVPGTQWIVSSGMAEGAGFYLVDSRAGNFSPLAFGAQPDAAFAGCPSPPTAQTLNTHGLSIRSTGPNRARLYVVGHGAREAIEVFDVDAAGARPALTWRGCVLMPDGLAANSVASFADGSIVATVLFMPGTTFADAIVALKPTGAVFEWSPGKPGFELVRGTELPANNGIETSADGREIYVASSGLQTVVAFSRGNPARQLRTTQPLGFTPDNVHLAPDGRLVTAGMANDVPECGGAPGPNHDIEKLSRCPRPTIAVAIDPKTMQHTVIATTTATPAFSNATMVLPVGKEAWIGSFSGDRIARAPLR